jgi:branched-chain amino acid transport system ATP-binding protein
MSPLLLQVHDLNAFYGDLQVLWGIHLDVSGDEIAAIIGGNGAGKTTLLRSIVGLHRHRQGSIHFQGEEISNVPCHSLIFRGLAEIPDERGIFPDLSVEKNLMIGAFSLKGSKVRRSALSWIYQVFPILQERRNFLARSLSGGEQQMLALGKGMITKPKLLLLDEPSSGLSPLMVVRLMDHIKRIHREGTAILLVEQNVHHALRIAYEVSVMENGRIIVHGKSDELMQDERLRRAYLGR